MKKQTAVEWLEQQMTVRAIEDIDSRPWNQIVAEALAMEKKQMINFTLDYIETQCECAYNGDIDFNISAEDYYNETYNTDTPSTDINEKDKIKQEWKFVCHNK